MVDFWKVVENIKRVLKIQENGGFLKVVENIKRFLKIEETGGFVESRGTY